jgi:hypothetical protein
MVWPRDYDGTYLALRGSSEVVRGVSQKGTAKAASNFGVLIVTSQARQNGQQHRGRGSTHWLVRQVLFQRSAEVQCIVCDH